MASAAVRITAAMGRHILVLVMVFIFVLGSFQVFDQAPVRIRLSSAGTIGNKPRKRPRLGYFLHGGRNLLAIGGTPAGITTLLKAWSSGDHAALDRLAERVYPELRLMARRYMKTSGPGNTLQATALVHEVYLRLADVTQIELRERAQFFAMAAQIMRRILVDAARERGALKRGGNALKLNLDETALLSSAPQPSILALDEALSAFSLVAPRQAKVVELRYFGGLTEEEIVAALKISARTVRRDWDLAKGWLLRELGHRVVRPLAHDPGTLPAN
jgi:RNA polymerase sigma factor (TIGR02999 family)